MQVLSCGKAYFPHMRILNHSLAKFHGFHFKTSLREHEKLVKDSNPVRMGFCMKFSLILTLVFSALSPRKPLLKELWRGESLPAMKIDGFFP
jgi:hypothetical protein